MRLADRKTSAHILIDDSLAVPGTGWDDKSESHHHHYFMRHRCHRSRRRTTASPSGVRAHCQGIPENISTYGRLSALEAWFVPGGGVHRLVESAYGAVNTLLNAVDRRYNAWSRGSDLAVDFRLLAQSLHRQPDDDSARQVYAAAFGDWPAWHVVSGPAEEDVEHATSAAAGQASFSVDLTLREHERHGPGGRPSAQGRGCRRRAASGLGRTTRRTTRRKTAPLRRPQARVAPISGAPARIVRQRAGGRRAATRAQPVDGRRGPRSGRPIDEDAPTPCYGVPIARSADTGRAGSGSSVIGQSEWDEQKAGLVDVVVVAFHHGDVDAAATGTV